MGKLIALLSLASLFVGCQTIMVDGKEVSALVVPMPNSYVSTWETIKLIGGYHDELRPTNERN